MAKVRGPLLSLGGSGSVAKTQVYSRWKGRPYVRQYVIPGNPDTDDQKLTRDVFRWLQRVYQTAPAEVLSAFRAGAENRVMTDRNLWSKTNLGALRGTLDVPVTTVSTLKFSPGARGGFPAVSAIATPDDGELSIAITPPDLPSGWSVQSVAAAAIRQQDPHDGTLYAVAGGSEEDPNDPVVLSGLTNDQVYVYGGWIVYNRPDGLLAYGASIGGTSTPTD